jgi:hypothetical protein
MGVTSAIAINKQNKAISSAQQDTFEQLQRQRQSIGRRAATQRLAINRQAARVVGRIRTGFTAGGVSGSGGGLIRAADFAAGLNRRTIGFNEANAMIAARDRANARIDELQRGAASVGIGAVQGALGGAQAGLSIASSVSNLLGGGAPPDDGTIQPATSAQTGFTTGGAMARSGHPRISNALLFAGS